MAESAFLFYPYSVDRLLSRPLFASCKVNQSKGKSKNFSAALGEKILHLGRQALVLQLQISENGFLQAQKRFRDLEKAVIFHWNLPFQIGNFVFCNCSVRAQKTTIRQEPAGICLLPPPPERGSRTKKFLYYFDFMLCTVIIQSGYFFLYSFSAF